MKELTRVKTSEVVGGNRMDRWIKQDALCEAYGGYETNNRHCRRANRMLDRM